MFKTKTASPRRHKKHEWGQMIEVINLPFDPSELLPPKPKKPKKKFYQL